MKITGRAGFLAPGRLSPRDRRAVLLGLAVVLPAAAYMFAVRPYRSALAEVRDRVAAEEELLARERALLASAPGLPEAIREAEADAEGAEDRMLRGRSAVLAEAELTDFLERSAFQSRVLLEEIRSGELARGEEPPPGLSVIRLHLRGESDLQGVLSFLDTIEKSRLLLRVRGLALEPEMTREAGAQNRQGAGASTPTGVVGLQLIVDGFAQPDVEALEGPAPASPSGG